VKIGDVQLLSYPTGTSHNFEVDQDVDAAGTRYYCADNVWSASAEASHTFLYLAVVEYLTTTTTVTTITVSSSPSTTTTKSSYEITSVSLVPTAGQTIPRAGTSSGIDWGFITGIVVAVLASASLVTILRLRFRATRRARVCASCGFTNPPYARAFCVKCGNPLEAP